MRIAIFWSEILHYHVARIRALQVQSGLQGHLVFPFALRASSPDLPVKGYHDLLDGQIRILSSDERLAGLYSSHSCSQVVDFLICYEPDVIGIPGYSSPVALAALEWCRRYKKGAVLMSDSKADDFDRSVLKEYLKSHIVRCFDAALVAGNPQAAYARELGLRAHQVFMGIDAVDNAFWSGWAQSVRGEADLWRKRLELAQHFYFSASRLVPKKNIAGLLRAYKLYSSRCPAAWPLVIAGDGRLRGELTKLAARLELERQVRFVGYLTPDAMAPYYSLASAFILPSGYTEQWGLVVNEAMASGTPVFVSRACGCADDLVIEGRNGFTFDPKDEDGLASLLAATTNGLFDLEDMGHQAQAHIERFSPQVFAKGFLAAAKVATEQAHARPTAILCHFYISAVRSILRKPPPGPE